MLYHRQRLALLLQAAYRRWRERQVEQLRQEATLAAMSRNLQQEEREQAFHRWRNLELSRGLQLAYTNVSKEVQIAQTLQAYLEEKRRHRSLAARALTRMCHLAAARALNLWRAQARARRASLLFTQSVGLRWLHSTLARAFGTWARLFSSRVQAMQLLRRSGVALFARKELIRQRKRTLDKFNRSAASWRHSRVGTALRRWRLCAGQRKRWREGLSRAGRAGEITYDPAVLRSYSVWKRGRTTGLWRRVRLWLTHAEVVYAYGGREGRGGERRRAVPLAWIDQVELLPGSSRGGSREWRVGLTSHGQMSLGVHAVAFGCAGREGARLWVEALRQACEVERVGGHYTPYLPLPSPVGAHHPLGFGVQQTDLPLPGRLPPPSAFGCLSPACTSPLRNNYSYSPGVLNMTTPPFPLSPSFRGRSARSDEQAIVWAPDSGRNREGGGAGFGLDFNDFSVAIECAGGPLGLEVDLNHCVVSESAASMRCAN
ncbi:MAG: hypothetical protein SGPRY_001443 [Prymnesium sp.]